MDALEESIRKSKWDDLYGKMHVLSILDGKLPDAIEYQKYSPEYNLDNNDLKYIIELMQIVRCNVLLYDQWINSNLIHKSKNQIKNLREYINKYKMDIPMIMNAILKEIELEQEDKTNDIDNVIDGIYESKLNYKWKQQNEFMTNGDLILINKHDSIKINNLCISNNEEYDVLDLKYKRSIKKNYSHIYNEYLSGNKLQITNGELFWADLMENIKQSIPTVISEDVLIMNEIENRHCIELLPKNALNQVFK